MATKPPDAVLHLESCLIRRYWEGDTEDVSREANNPKIAKWMTNRFPSPYTIDDAKKWITTATYEHNTTFFAICRRDDSRVIGGCGLEPRNDVNYRTMAIGYWLGEAHWGRGIATEAVAALSQWAFKTFDHVIRLEAIVYEGNGASARVLEKAGYHCESRNRCAVEKNGVVLDTMTYCMLR
ncbi:acyl-CoA N-acyltransferase [Aspergillus ambiguus]|uniref:GNAT family N-acetyltransferase n=1 Tax=Aspergillus ambiguus TaxID=176160 RepID=UPI003CCCCA6C